MKVFVHYFYSIFLNHSSLSCTRLDLFCSFTALSVTSCPCNACRLSKGQRYGLSQAYSITQLLCCSLARSLSQLSELFVSLLRWF